MFSVRWSPSASADFAAISILYPNRWNDIDDAGDDLDDKLRLDPMTHGQHISEDLWRIISRPLVAYYTVDGNEVTI